MTRRALIARRLSSEQGYSLIELLVAMIVALIVCAAAVTFMAITSDEQDEISGRALAASRAETGLEQMVMDLRDSLTGVSLTASSGTATLTLSIPKPNSQTTGGDTGETVTWTCTGSTTTTTGTCQRALQGAYTKTEISGVSSISFTPKYSGTATTTTNATDIASMAIQLSVLPVSQINPSKSIAGTQTTSLNVTSKPIVLNATADLRNFT
jgi:prepilin-type N-terminal cleavage/methylation domain-containing protein